MQDIRQQRLESDKDTYARRLQLAQAEAQQKAEDANKRYATCSKPVGLSGGPHCAEA